MCLYIGSKNKFVAKHDIIVYKELSEESIGEWVTPFRRWPIEFNKVLTPEGVAREKEHGYKFIIEEGVIHAYTFSPDSERGCKRSFIAKIPAGTKFWLQDDLRAVAAEKMIITTEHPKPGERLDLSEYYHLGVDVYLKDGRRAKNNGSFSISDVIGLFAFDNMVISTKVEKEAFSGFLADPKKEYQYTYRLKEAEKDMNGYTHTKSIEKYLIYHPAIDICKKLGEDWYIPAFGELIKAFSNLLYINLTLRKLNLPTINIDWWFWSSSVKNSGCAWGCCCIGDSSMDYRNGVYCMAHILPFLDLS